MEVHEKDGIWNTSIWKPMILKMVLSLFMNYPSLYGSTYLEFGNEWVGGIAFNSNDLLLCMMLFCRFHYVIKILLSVSYYTDPRSQRVC